MKCFILLLAAAFGVCAFGGGAPTRAQIECRGALLAPDGDDRSVAEFALQSYQFARTEDAREAAAFLLDGPFKNIFHRYFSRRGVVDFQAREDLIQETFIAVLRRGRSASQKGPIADFVRYAYVVAKYKMYRSRHRVIAYPSGDLNWIDDGSRSLWTPERDREERLAGISVPTRTSEDLADVELAPIPLSARQLSIFRRLATGESQIDVTRSLGLGPREISDSLGNLETKLAKRLGVSKVLRTQFRLLTDLTNQSRVFVEITLGKERRTVVAEGPLPFLPKELSFLAHWLGGSTVSDIASDLGLDLGEARQMCLRLLMFRRHDFDELFGARLGELAATIELEFPPSEARYAHFRAFGLSREEIREATGAGRGTVNAWDDHLKRRLKAALEPRNIEVDWRRPYYAMVEDSRDQVRIVLTGKKNELYLVRGKVVDRTSRVYRNRQALRIERSRADVEQELVRMGGVPERVLRLRLFGGFSTERIARTLEVGVDTVRKSLAEATFRLGVAFDEPELNAWNLVVTE